VSIGYYRTCSQSDGCAETPPSETAMTNTCDAAREHRLSGFGGNTVCNLYDPQPQLSRMPHIWCRSLEFRQRIGCVHGIDASVNARFHGLVLQGGVTAGHEVTNYCVRVNSPQDLFWTSTRRLSPLNSPINNPTLSTRLPRSHHCQPSKRRCSLLHQSAVVSKSPVQDVGGVYAPW